MVHVLKLIYNAEVLLVSGAALKGPQSGRRKQQQFSFIALGSQGGEEGGYHRAGSFVS